MLSYRVNQIFQSIQGEGSFTGWPATFIRFQGCNLDCYFCDTQQAISHDGGSQWSIDEIMAVVNRRANPTKLAVLTGGEPMLQPMGPIVQALHVGGWKVHLETNGTIAIPSDIDFDWIVLSPKDSHHPLDANVWMADEIKWLVRDITDIRRVVKWTRDNHTISAVISLQPVSQDKSATLLAYYAALDYGFRLSIQVHKYIGAP